MPVGAVLSVFLHIIVALLAVFGLPFIVEPPPPVEESIPVDLVPLGATTTAPPPKADEVKPEEKPPEPPKQEVKPEQPKPEPPKEEAKVEPPKVTPPPPPPPSPPPPPPPPPPKAEVPVPAPTPKPEPPKEVPKPPDQLAEVKPQKKPPPPPDDMSSLLKTLDKMRPQPTTPDKPPDKKPDTSKPVDLAKAIDALRPSPPVPQPPSQQVAAATPSPNLSDQASASDKDYIAGQFRRCWTFDAGARDPTKLIVKIHVLLRPDGSVASSEIVSDPRYDADDYFRSAADSARRATLNPQCVPIKIPPGKYDALKDLILTFDPRNSVQ
jgi:hypothetical protein